MFSPGHRRWPSFSIGYSSNHRQRDGPVDCPLGIVYCWQLDKGSLVSHLHVDALGNKCAPKGVCGMNAFCTIMDNEPQCRCLPGFSVVVPGKWSSGCNRNFTAISCEEDIDYYEMRALENTVWQSNSYASLKTSTKEDCEQACLEDCNCEAAQFKDGNCNKDRLPLIYGIRGTKGYVAPEWHRKMAVTVKADVYSFGIVLLELITRRKSVDWSLSEDEAVLEEWVYSCFDAGEVSKVVGEEEVEKKQVERLVKIAIWCTQEEPSLRPSMKKVLLMLEGTVDIPVPPSPTSFLSAV
nr:G-type lectin S-receptor-like serine/threonine-protein kinase LECRK3 [Ipomoea batatas]